MTRPTGPGPLAGLRVIDLSAVVAAPQACRYLADFGADVITVERAGGDGTRRFGWEDPADGTALWFKLLNRNKRGIVLDLKDDADREVLLRLVDDADVLVENNRPGRMEKLGLGPDVLHRRNPRLVITRVSGFGQDGPYAQRPGFATLAEAMSGYADVTGEPGGGPHLPPVALGDEITGMVAAMATLAAVHRGEGEIIDVDLLTSMSAVMGPLFAARATHGYVQPRLGSGLPYTVPRAAYECGDGRWVAVSASAEEVGRRVMELIGKGGDERFDSFAGRVEHRDELDAAMAEWIGARTTEEVLAGFAAVDAAVAPILTTAELMEDPHAIARDMFPVVDGVPFQGPVARFARSGTPEPRPAPTLDEHGEGIRRNGWGPRPD